MRGSFGTWLGLAGYRSNIGTPFDRNVEAESFQGYYYIY